MMNIRFKKPKSAAGKAKIVENPQKTALKEVTDEELEHIEYARLLEPEDLAFSELFGDKRRIIIDFEQFSEDTALGKFVKMFQTMGYDADWDKGTVSAVKSLKSSLPSHVAARLMSDDYQEPRPRKIHMKIGKWLKKTYEYATKLEDLTNKIIDHHGGNVEPGRITGNMAKEALDEQEYNAYFRNHDLLEMMTGPLMKRFSERPYELANLSSWWQTNAGSIKKDLKDAMHDDDVIIITRHPIDVFRMSDFKNIRSCHSPPSREGHVTQQYKCAVAEAHGHGAVAYVVDREELLDEYGVNTLEGVEQQIQDPDHELFYDDERVNDGPIEPKYRVRLRQMRYYDEDDALNASIGQGTEIAVPERRMYPEGLPGFVERIMKWARSNQEQAMSGAPRKGDALDMGRFIKFGGSYEDNHASVLLADLFAKQFREFLGNPLQNTDTEEELESNLAITMVDTENREITIIENSYNYDYKYCKVNGEAVDDDGSIVVEIEARVRFEWPVDEWSSLPNPVDMRYCVEDLKEGAGAYQNQDGVWTTAYMQEDASTIVRMGDVIVAHIVLNPMRLIGMDSYFEYIGGGASGFGEFCHALRIFDKQKAPALRQDVENYFKREGYIDGGEMMRLGREIENGEWRFSEWGSEAIGDEYEGFDEINAEMTVAIPKLESVRVANVGEMPLLNFIAQEEVRRAITIELRRRISEEPRQEAETKYYLPFRIISITAAPNTDEIYVRLEFTLPYDSNDEMVSLMRQILENVTEEEVTSTLESVIKELLGSQIDENIKRDASWALKRWKNNFI